MTTLKWLFGRTAQQASAAPESDPPTVAAGFGTQPVRPALESTESLPESQTDLPVKDVSMLQGAQTDVVSVPIQEPSMQAAHPTVTMVDGVYHLQINESEAIPFLQNNQPLRNLGPGWYFHSLNIAFAPVLLFELVHDNGNRATWFFDSTPKYVGNKIEDLPPNLRDTFKRKTTLLLHALVSPLLGPALPISTTTAAGFFSVSEIARHQILEAFGNVLMPTAQYVLLSNFPDHLVATPQGADGPVTLISRNAVAAALREDFQDRLLAAVTDGYLSWPSIVNGRLIPVSAALCFHHFSYAYRVEEPTSGHVYFVLASEHNARLIGIYLPAEGMIVCVDDWSMQCVQTSFHDLVASVINYFSRFGETLSAQLRRPGPKHVAASMRETHLGHHLWNELSGLEALAVAKPLSELPQVIPLGGRATNCFGPLIDLYPEFADKVQEQLLSERNIIDYANDNDLLLARFTRMYVSANLRNRVINYMARTNDFQMALAARSAFPGPVMLIGLRVENRTVINLVQFLNDLIDHISRVAPGTTVVLDGQNRRDDMAPLGSFADQLAVRSPLDVEAELCERVMAAAAGKAVQVVTTTGHTVANSLGWIVAAECFIAIWGAGLAKYRWIGNKPGLILSSHFHLTNPAEISIYHLPSMMETPTPVIFATADCVNDDFEAAQLVPVAGPRHVSFHVDESLFFPQVTAFLNEFLLPADQS
jgi:hypothetical protein